MISQLCNSTRRRHSLTYEIFTFRRVSSMGRLYYINHSAKSRKLLDDDLFIRKRVEEYMSICTGVTYVHK